MIRLSPSLVKDFITCPRRVYYRLNFPEEAEVFPYFQVGISVHSAIERYKHDEDSAIKFAFDNCLVNGLSIEDANKARTYVKNFFDIVKENGIDLSSGESEIKFEVKIRKHIITGRLDFVTGDSVYDWKTSVTVFPVNYDIQFILYRMAIDKLYGRNVKLFYVSLPNKKIIEYKDSNNLASLVLEDILPFVERSVKANLYPPTGIYVYNDVCRTCQFKRICHTQLGILKNKELSLF